MTAVELALALAEAQLAAMDAEIARLEEARAATVNDVMELRMRRRVMVPSQRPRVAA